MLDKIMLWWLRREYRFHRRSMDECSELFYYAVRLGDHEDEGFWFEEYQYHDKECKRIETMIYNMTGESV
jgi:hypothetical protein